MSKCCIWTKEKENVSLLPDYPVLNPLLSIIIEESKNDDSEVDILSFLKVVSATLLLVLFCMCKREHLWNKKKCFLLHLESSFCSGDNQILTFQIFKSWRHQMYRHEIRNTLLNNSGINHSLLMKFGQFI